MIAFRIQINGELICVAGQEDSSILHTNLNASTGNNVDDYVRLKLGGLSHEIERGYREHFRWKGRDLKVGDVVMVKIVDTDTIDTPVKRYRSDNLVQENPFTEDELREMRYNDYLNLKDEFEPGGAA